MFLTVDASDKRPLYQQIVDGVKALIARGELREGMTLPSVRQVAGDLGVNLNTIAIAYRQLQDEGFLSVRHGAGAVVSSQSGHHVEEVEVRRSLRTVLTQLVLGGFTDRDITRVVRQELELLHEKGNSRGVAATYCFCL
jgi:GntR family transcriptional regulator